MTVVEMPKPEQAIGDKVQSLADELQSIIDKNCVQNIVLVMTGADGSVISTIANGKDPFVLIGALENMKQQIIDNHIER